MIKVRNTILLVEDDPNDVLLMQLAFREIGLADSLQVVGNGDEAVAYLSGEGDYAERRRHSMPALILLDLKLPRKSGHEFLSWLRDQSGLRRLPVIVMTASDRRADIDMAYDLGANSYIVKPGAPSVLREIVTSIRLYWLTLNTRPEVPGG